MATRRTTGYGSGAGALGLALAVAASAPAAAPPPKNLKESGLAGKLLVASPRMNDPRFSRTVIYVVRHDANGAMGLVVNRPFKEVSIASVLEALGLEHDKITGSLRVHYGGPVGPGSVLVLHSADYAGKGTKLIGFGVALTVTPDVLRALGSGAGPRRALLALSYSGWAPGQLEQEIHAGAWVVVPGDPALVFDGDYETTWDRALARREVEL